MSAVNAKIPPNVATPPEDHAAAETIGARLKRLRLDRGLSQRDLSSPGVSYAYISRIEAGARTPSVKALRMLAAKLNVSVDYLETGREVGAAEERELRLSDAELEIRLGTDTAEAEQKLTAVLDESLRAGDRVSASRAAVGLGFAAARKGNHLDAVERLEQALAENPVGPHQRPDLYATLGQSYAALGAADRAVRLFENATERLSEYAPGDASLKIRFAALLSYALADAGQHDRAAAVIRESLEQAGGDADPANSIRLYWSMSRLDLLEGRLSEALHYIRRAICLLEVTENTVQVARGYLLAAGIEAREGRVAETRSSLERAEQLLGANAETRDVGMLRTGQSWLAGLEGDSKTAVARAREALDAFAGQHAAEQGTAAWALGRGLALDAQIDAAADAYQRAVDLLSIHGRRSDAAAAADEWARTLSEHGREDEAESMRVRAAGLGAATNKTGR